MKNSNENWNSIKAYLQLELDKQRENLEQDAIESIHHYINHDEFEMAFEGLFLEMFKMKRNALFDEKKAEEIALLLKLNRQTVFDDNFWYKFTRYIGLEGTA